MKIVICIGSSCHLKGSRLVVEKFQKMIVDNDLNDSVELEGTFCMGKCQTGVNVKIDNEYYTVAPENAEEFFEENVIKKLKK